MMNVEELAQMKHQREAIRHIQIDTNLSALGRKAK